MNVFISKITRYVASLIAIAVLAFFASTDAHATGGVDIADLLPWNITTFGDLISFLLPNILIFAGIVLFIYSLVGGFMIMNSGGNAEQAGKGKQALTYGVLGFVIVFSAYFIIQFVEFITGVPIFNSGL